MKTIRIFISSPGDVTAERSKTVEILGRLQSEFCASIKISPYYWEHEPFGAHADFQSQIERPSQFDIVVCLLWSRLGTRLHPGIHKKADGSAYSSGTEYEFLDALESYKNTGSPELLLYRRTEIPSILISPIENAQRAAFQYQSLQDFFTRYTQNEGCFTTAINDYTSVAHFESKFESDLRKVIQRRFLIAANDSSIPPKTWTNGSPFRGLRHFELEHSPIFFGRTEDTFEIINALKEQAADGRAFVLIFGASGVGKSSLAHAGVLAWLVRPNIVPGIAIWRRASMRPSEIPAEGGDLIDALTGALLKDYALPELTRNGATKSEIAKMLREFPEGAVMLIKGVLSDISKEQQLAMTLESQPKALCALVVDQLEELFTIDGLCCQRTVFIRAIDSLARSGLVWVVATLRSDFYQRCEETPILMDLKKGQGQYHLQSPNKEQLLQMILKPAMAAGLRFEENQETGITLLDQLRNSYSETSGMLPLLEFALEELYVHRDTTKDLLLFDSFLKMGGVVGALGKRAEESFLKLSPVGRSSFSRVFQKLVTINANEDDPTVRKRTRKDDLQTDPGSTELVDQLIADRLLVADHVDESLNVVSVAHEAMLESWPRLREWTLSQRRSLKCHAAITTDTKRWIEHDKKPDFLCPRGAPLNDANEALKAGFLSREEEEFVNTSLRAIVEQDFREALVTGEHVAERSLSIKDSHIESWQRILADVLRGEHIQARVNAAKLLGTDAKGLMAGELLHLVLQDRHPAVRREAALSLVKLDHECSFEELEEMLKSRHPEALDALAHIRVAVDETDDKTPTSFETHFAKIHILQRKQILIKSWFLRLIRGLPTLLMILVPALALSSLSAAIFKFFPGLFNYALCQADAGGAAASFHAIAAAFLWGGIITFSIALHAIVFFSRRSKKSYLRPYSTIVFGAAGGLISSILVTLVATGVCASETVIGMGWTNVNRGNFPKEFWHDVLWQTRYFWPYVLMGTGLGIGMATTTNGLRASRSWAGFLEKQSTLTGGRSIAALTVRLTRLVAKNAWPIVFCLVLADIASFYVLRTAPTVHESRKADLQYYFTGGKSGNSAERIEWKKSPWGQGLGIGFDSATQAIGGFFSIVGMGIGIVAIRYGIKIDPRRN